ncbi:hypothetical protein VIBNISFn118_1240031 [Vibrio nigripulchritudo SFn118]|nr:hypothetical protein VIBNISFn118_1240031 [Vibrio nigripulchritudo SFn118]
MRQRTNLEKAGSIELGIITPLPFHLLGFEMDWLVFDMLMVKAIS